MRRRRPTKAGEKTGRLTDRRQETRFKVEPKAREHFEPHREDAANGRAMTAHRLCNPSKDTTLFLPKCLCLVPKRSKQCRFIQPGFNTSKPQERDDPNPNGSKRMLSQGFGRQVANVVVAQPKVQRDQHKWHSEN